MPEPWSIRGAHRSEVEPITALLEPVMEEYGTLPPKGVAEYVRSANRTPEVDWLVAVGRKQVIGVARTQMFSLGQTDNLVEGMAVGDLVVDPAVRRLGIGTAILERCLAFGEERMLDVVKLNVPHETVAVKALAAKVGFGSQPPYMMELFKPDLELPPIPRDDKGDARVPSPLQRKTRFISDAYPGEEFSEEEIGAVFEYLPQIIEPYRHLFHPRTQGRLDGYLKDLDTYVQSNESTRKIILATGFRSPNALLVWKRGFAEAIAGVIDAESMKSTALLLAGSQYGEDS